MKIPFIGGKCKLTSPFGTRTLNGKSDYHSGYDLVGVGSDEVEREATDFERLEAQTLYTALMTGTLLEG